MLFLNILLNINNMAFISSRTIVQKIIRDYNVVNLSWVEDSNHWVREALQHIGTKENKLLVKKDFEIENTTLNLPCDLEDLLGIVQDGCFIRFQRDTNLNTFADTNTIRPSVNGNKINFNTTNLVKGTLYYYSFMNDCKDDIMLVDKVQVTEAVANYIILKLMQRGMKHPVISYTDAYQLWENTKEKASNYLKFPAPYEISFVLSEFPNPML